MIPRIATFVWVSKLPHTFTFVDKPTNGVNGVRGRFSLSVPHFSQPHSATTKHGIRNGDRVTPDSIAINPGERFEINPLHMFR